MPKRMQQMQLLNSFLEVFVSSNRSSSCFTFTSSFFHSAQSFSLSPIPLLCHKSHSGLLLYYNGGTVVSMVSMQQNSFNATQHMQLSVPIHLTATSATTQLISQFSLDGAYLCPETSLFFIQRMAVWADLMITPRGDNVDNI